MTDTPAADALADSLDVPTPAEWREAVRVMRRVAPIFARFAPVLAPKLAEAEGLLDQAREPVALLLALQQPPPPEELPGG